MAIDSAPAVEGVPDLAVVKSSTVYCSVKSMPAGATRVNGLTVEGLAEHKPFGFKVRSVVRALTQSDVIAVTFNGARFDLAVIARYAAAHGKLAPMIDAYVDETTTRADHRDCFEELLNERHVDVARVWQVLRKREAAPPWDAWADDDSWLPIIHAGMFAGSLTAAHGFFEGCGFDGAHDAGVDNRATLTVLRDMLVGGFVDLDTALRWSSGPLPGDVDFEGKFRWEGDQAVCSLAKWRDVPIEKIDRGFLQWMLGKDFHRHTKKVVSEFLAGDYPIRNYEDESTNE